MHSRTLISALLLCISFCALGARAETIVFGTIPSGSVPATWTPAGNPYNIIDHCVLSSGATLTIQPGCMIVIAPDVTVTASNSLIQAVGTVSERITFQFSSSSTSIVQSHIFMRNPPGNPVGTNRFKYCDFRGVCTTYLIFSQYGGNTTQYAEVVNCTFEGSRSQAIYAEGQGSCCMPGQWGQINPLIKNCVFNNTGFGCSFWADSMAPNDGQYGSNAPVVVGNIFQNLVKGIYLGVYNRAGSSPLTLLNNTFTNCVAAALDSQEPWDARVQNNIFAGCGNAVVTSGSLSRVVSYNDFWKNGTNFIGYPASYGMVATLNRSGTPCDLSYNIFQSPLFVAADNFHLSTNSLCVDAGEGSAANYDICFPPSLASSTNDIGAYGGPSACGWLPTIPTSTNLTVVIAKYVGVTIIPATNGTYRLEYASALQNTNTWMELTNVTLNAPFNYYDRAEFGQRFYRVLRLQ